MSICVEKEETMQQAETKLMTIEETAKYLNVKKSKLRSMVFKKEIPIIRLGRLLRFNQAEIDNWLISKKS